MTYLTNRLPPSSSRNSSSNIETGRLEVPSSLARFATNLAATGASPIAMMATAGHRSMQTTKQYLHLAGVVFRDERRRSSGGSASRSR
jgi:hypothetical protein